jgi:hypothetical protein
MDLEPNGWVWYALVILSLFLLMLIITLIATMPTGG